MTSTQYPPTIFVLGTQQHVGKTVTCIGVIAKLLSPEYGYRVDQIGYIKPVGQQTVIVKNAEGKPLYVDKDAVLVTSLLEIPIPRYEVTSPVLWLGGLTASYIDDQVSDSPQMPPDVFAQRVREAYEEVAQGKEIVIVEGTGQPGVGSVGGICNGDVIRMLREMGVPLYVLLVVEAGIGSTIDRLFPYLIAMDRLGAYVDGIIVNRVFPERLDKIVHYL
ncbi:MAG: dethiobiotin synthase, partial [Chloroflexi bacterium]|nr:dethiobiotin synthase [Chloroflexota bacterium]